VLKFDQEQLKAEEGKEKMGRVGWGEVLSW
jgi:hypothetical protein